MRTLLLALLLLAACNPSAPPAGGGDGKKPPAPLVRPQPSGPDFSTVSSQFVGDFVEDAAKARGKYRGKTAALLTQVVSAGRDKEGAFLLIDGPEGGTAKGRAYTREAEPWKRAAPGQLAAIVGRHDGRDGPVLADVEIQKVEGKPPPALAPDELADASEKHRDKWVRLTGEVAGAETKGSDTFALLKKKGTTMHPRFRSPVELKRGQKAELVGPWFGGGPVGLDHCILVGAK
ncbi:MAG: hypothetical protein K2W96_03135 [Gemmataceae bacterium]|nr:hypothetical protein [Gemmataceae bacterium]